MALTSNSTARQTFVDRRQAGRVLATHLGSLIGRDDVVVLGLPRGGVPVAAEVARVLGAPLDVFLVRKLGMPGHREFAIGAIAAGGVRVINTDVVRTYGIPTDAIEAIAHEEQVELDRRASQYRHGQGALQLRDRVVVLVDDGLATGATMHAAVEAVRQLDPGRVIVAVPVGAPSTCRELRAIADEVVCARTPEPFTAVGQWYDDFSQTTDEEVLAVLEAAAGRAHLHGGA